MKGVEERDALFARLFGLGAIIESNLIFRSTATLIDFKLVLGELWGLGEKKSWIRESAWFMILKAVKGLLGDEGEKVEWREEAVKAILRRVYGYDEKEEQSAGSRKGKGMDWTEEKVALSVVLQYARPVSQIYLNLTGVGLNIVLTGNGLEDYLCAVFPEGQHPLPLELVPFGQNPKGESDRFHVNVDAGLTS